MSLNFPLLHDPFEETASSCRATRDVIQCDPSSASGNVASEDIFYAERSGMVSAQTIPEDSHKKPTKNPSKQKRTKEMRGHSVCL